MASVVFQQPARRRISTRELLTWHRSGETINYAIEFDTETSDSNGNATGYPTPILASGTFVVGTSQEVSVPITYTYTGDGFSQTFSGTATIFLNGSTSTLKVGFSGTAQLSI